MKPDQVFFGVESVMCVNADSLLIRAATTSTSGTFNDLTTDLIMANNNTTKYPCPVYASNVTSRTVSYLCNRCSGWVHSKCSGLQNAAEYRRIETRCHKRASMSGNSKHSKNNLKICVIISAFFLYVVDVLT